MRFFDPLMDSLEITQRQLHYFCYELTREAIVRWLDQELAASGDADDLDDSSPNADV